MDATDIPQLIGTLGFPIVACGVLFYTLYYLISTFVALVNTTLKDLQASMDQVGNSLDEVNKTLAIIISKIEEV